MIPLKTIPAYSPVFTAVSKEAVDIRPPILFRCSVCKQSYPCDSDASHKHTSSADREASTTAPMQFPGAPPASKHF